MARPKSDSPKGSTVQVRFESFVLDAIKADAEKQGITVSEWIRDCCHERTSGMFAGAMQNARILERVLKPVVHKPDSVVQETPNLKPVVHKPEIVTKESAEKMARSAFPPSHSVKCTCLACNKARGWRA